MAEIAAERAEISRRFPEVAKATSVVRATTVEKTSAPLADVRYLLLDGWYPKVRLGKRRVRVPVLVTMGVRADGERVVVDMRLVGDESTAAWRDVVQPLQARHVGTPALAIIDGNAGLATALREAWPSLPIQRCTAHTLRNLTAKAPVRQREEVAEDYRRVVYAETVALMQQRRTAFVKKWRLQCPAVARRPATSCSPSSAFPDRSGKR